MSDFSAADSRPIFSETEPEIHSMEPWAIISLVLGFFSVAALITPILWLLPILGVLTGAVALRRIQLDAGRIGRTIALFGLGLSLAFGVMPLAHYASAWVLLSRQARPMADQFFEYLRQDHPEKALMLQYVSDFRQPLDESLWTYYQHDNEAKLRLAKFVQFPLVRTLLALGPRAEVRYFKTNNVASDGSRAQVDYRYTVTFADEAGKKTTFLVGVLLERKLPKDPGLNPWQIKDFVGGVNPDF